MSQKIPLPSQATAASLTQVFASMVERAFATSATSINYRTVGAVTRADAYTNMYSDIYRFYSHHFFVMSSMESIFFDALNAQVYRICASRVALYQTENARVLASLVFGAAAATLYHPRAIQGVIRNPNAVLVFVKRQVWLTRAWNMFVALLWDANTQSQTILRHMVTVMRAQDGEPQLDAGLRQKLLAFSMAHFCLNIFMRIYQDPNISNHVVPIWLPPAYKLDISMTPLPRIDYGNLKIFRHNTMFRASMHLHSFRATRTAIQPLPLAVMNIYDPQDYAAAMQHDTKIGQMIVDLTQKMGTLLALSLRPKTPENKVTFAQQTFELRKSINVAGAILKEGETELAEALSNDDVPLYSELHTDKWIAKDPSHFNSILLKRTDDIHGREFYDTDALKMKEAMLHVNQLASNVTLLKALIIQIENDTGNLKI